MSLMSLRDMNPSDALEALATAALLVAPNPAGLPQDITTYVNLILDEVRTRLRLNLDDTSLDALGRIQDELSSAMDEVLFRNHDELEIKSRLADRRQLPFGGYEVEYLTSKRVTKPISRRNLDLCLQQPDLFEVVDPPQTGRRRPEQFGSELYGKYVDESSGNYYLLIVLTLRNAFTIRVIGALKIDPRKVDLDGVDSLKLSLERFADYYGVEFELPGFGRGKFFHDLRFSYVERQSRFDAILSQVGKEHFYTEMTGSNNEKTGTYLLFAFLTDTKKYLKSVA